VSLWFPDEILLYPTNEWDLSGAFNKTRFNYDKYLELLKKIVNDSMKIFHFQLAAFFFLFDTLLKQIQHFTHFRCPLIRDLINKDSIRQERERQKLNFNYLVSLLQTPQITNQLVAHSNLLIQFLPQISQIFFNWVDSFIKDGSFLWSIWDCRVTYHTKFQMSIHVLALNKCCTIIWTLFQHLTASWQVFLDMKIVKMLW
jgi:hypothetical protein